MLRIDGSACDMHATLKELCVWVRITDSLYENRNELDNQAVQLSGKVASELLAFSSYGNSNSFGRVDSVVGLLERLSD